MLHKLNLTSPFQILSTKLNLAGARRFLVLWLLRKCTQHEFVRILLNGLVEIHKGDLVAFTGGEIAIGQVVALEGDIVTIQIFRRPK